MSNLEQIEAAILSLPSTEFEKLRLWFLDLDYERWDEQIEQDIEDGKLEAFAQEAIAEFDALHDTTVLAMLQRSPRKYSANSRRVLRVA